MKEALILDSNSLYARSWYAAESAGDDKQTKHFMLRTLLGLLTDQSMTDAKISHALCCWDGKAKNDKNRQPKPQLYYDTMSECSELIDQLIGIPQCCLETEGEDQVATAAWNCCKDKDYLDVVVASGDKDVKQLAGMFGKVRFYCLNQKSILNKRLICVKYGVNHPSHIGLALAVMGDSTDNIQGVPNWGQVKVRKLFADFTEKDSLEHIAESIMAQMKPQHVEGFLRDMDLTILNTGLEGVPMPGPISLASPEKFMELGFTRLSQYSMQYSSDI